MNARRNQFMKIFASMLAACALAAGAAGAATSTASTSGTTVAADAPQQGAIEEYAAGTALRVNGRRYAFSLLSATVHDRQGNPVHSPKLAVGKTIAYTVDSTGSTPRIKQVWMID
jgi:hypothetical protein